MNKYFKNSLVKPPKRTGAKLKGTVAAVAAMCIACTLFFTAPGCRIQVGDGQEVSGTDPLTSSDFYYNEQGEMQNFTVCKDKVMIKTKSEADAKELCNQSLFRSADIVNFVFVLASIDPTKTKLDDLLKRSDVVSATYGLKYLDGSTIQYPNGEIFVKCKEEHSVEKLLNDTGLNENVESMELFRPETKIYLISLNVNLGDIFAACRKLFETGFCEFAEPSFFREMKLNP